MNLKQLVNNADFWAGCMFMAFGAAAIYISQDYPMGSARRMGPGYFPHYLGILLVIIGMVIAVRGVVAPGHKIGRWAIRPLLVLGIAVSLYSWIIDDVGFIPALIVLIVGSVFAGREIRLLEIVFLTIILVVGAVSIFIYGLGLPYQLFWWY